jgi:dolichol-phosphate mannosyltransferase
MRCLVAIPVFNEARYLPGVIASVRRFTSDLLIVDDGSTDETPTLVAQHTGLHVLRHPVNQGYGSSLIDAFAYAALRHFDWVITLDCDEQHEPGFIPDFLERAARNDADIISGSRYLTPSTQDTDAPADRRRINGVITDMLNSVLGLSLTDSFCGFKAHRVSAMQRLNLTETGYAFPLQFWTEAKRADLRIAEIAVPRIYNDPNRHFGGKLDDSDTRLRHYLDVLCESLTAANLVPPRGCPGSQEHV